MPRGIILCTDSQIAFENHRILLNKKAPFQKIDENHFIKKPDLKWKLNSELVQDLIELKKAKSVRSKYGHLFLTLFAWTAIGVFVLSLMGY